MWDLDKIRDLEIDLNREKKKKKKPWWNLNKVEFSTETNNLILIIALWLYKMLM